MQRAWAETLVEAGAAPRYLPTSRPVLLWSAESSWRSQEIGMIDGPGTSKGSSRRNAESGAYVNAWFASALLCLPDGIIAMDRKGVVVVMNPAAERLIGSSASVGRPLTEVLRLRHRRTGQALPSPLAEVLATGAVVELEQHAVLIREDGAERFLEGRAAPISDGSTVVGAVLSFRDATHHRLEELEIAKVVEQLRDTLSLGERITRLMGHDLRNPLGSIIMSAQVLLRSGGDASAAPARRILSSGRRMSKMIEQLLDLTRIRSTDGMAIRPVSMNIGEVCREQLEELTNGCERRPISVDFGGDLTGDWDRDRLAQVIQTLVSNAVQHGDPDGAIAVKLDGTRAESVTLQVESRGEVHPMVLPVLFDPSRCLDAPRKKAQGLGLGLWISQEVVRRHGGSLTVASGGGRTVLAVRLPRRCAAHSPRL